MSMVMYATLCDRCGARSPEYTSWPACPGDCMEDICPRCMGENAQEDEHYRWRKPCADCLAEAETEVAA